MDHAGFPDPGRPGVRQRRNQGTWTLKLLWTILVASIGCILYILTPFFQQYLGGNKSTLEPVFPKSSKTTKLYDDKDFIDAMEPFWQGYQTLLLDFAAYETWFNNAEINSEVIATMLEAVPLSYYSDRTGNDYVQVPMINMGARERAKDLADAKLAFEGFLATRKQIIRDVISNTFMWRQYADSENMEYLLKIADPTNKIAENEVKYNAVRTAAYARRLASNLSQVQSNTWLPVIDLTTSQVEAAYRNVTSARDYERQFINTLLTKSAKAGLWDRKRYADVMSQLWMNMGKTLRASENIGQTLQRINGGWSSLGTKTRTPEEAALLWARVARDLLRNWVMVLMNSQEGILFTLRRNQYTAAGQGPDFDRSESDVSWEVWKNRNCGGTSCYDVEGTINSLMTKLGVSMKPLAGRAKDEVEWKAKVGARGSKVWRKTYEEACCVDGDLAEFLKYVPSGTIDAFGRLFREW